MDTLNFTDLNEDLFQGILVISCTKLLPTQEWLKRIIRNAMKNPGLEFQPVLENGVKLLKFDVEHGETLGHMECHCALLDNKYYTTQVYLMPLEEIVYFPERFYDFFHGILIYFDNNDENGLKQVHKWIDYIDNMENCAIKILACETATDHNSLSRVDIQNYCIDKGFELIELRPFSELYDDDLEDDFKESNSFERLYQAIQAYVWPNLNYKQKGTDISSFLSQTNNDLIGRINLVTLDDKTSSENEPETESKSTLTSTTFSKNDEDMVTEKDVDNFEDIFSRFSEIKQHASNLDDSSRKQYAEQVAIKFWNSISDDKDEIGFSSEEEAEPNHVYI